jgi:Ca-activated chloride channel family protein
MDMNKQIREELRGLANKNFESVKEEINKKYSENIN